MIVRARWREGRSVSDTACILYIQRSMSCACQLASLYAECKSPWDW